MTKVAFCAPKGNSPVIVELFLLLYKRIDESTHILSTVKDQWAEGARG